MLIVNALLTDASGQKTGALRIENGKIAEVGNLAAREGEPVEDAGGAWLMPGLVDLSFHLKDPGQKRIESIETSRIEALKGGITTLLAAPDTTPAVDNETVVEYIGAKASATRGARVLIAGEIAKGGKLNNLSRLMGAGVAALAGSSAMDGNLLRRSFEYALMADRPVLIACENEAIEGNGVMNDGNAAARLGLPGLPDYAESSEAVRVAELADALQNPLLIEAVSAQRTLRALAPFKAANAKLALSCLLPHLLLDETACEGFNTACKLFPPLRGSHDRQALIDGVKSGLIDIVATGHLPQEESAKDRPFEQAAAGIGCAGEFLSLVYTCLIEPGLLDAPSFIRAAAANPAKLLKEPCGALQAGLRADLVLFDPALAREVTAREGVSKSPWHGQKLKGRVLSAWVGGEMVEGFSGD
ncbi:MAG: amidohydrolase family protein [Campylobacterales bacterium]